MSTPTESDATLLKLFVHLLPDMHHVLKLHGGRKTCLDQLG